MNESEPNRLSIGDLLILTGVIFACLMAADAFNFFFNPAPAPPRAVQPSATVGCP